MIEYASKIKTPDVIPSGLFLDNLTGIGGIPRGRITELYGDEGIGKSTLCLQLVAHAQQLGYRCLWADVEWSYHLAYAESLGVNNETLGLLRTEFAEDILDGIEEAVQSGEWDLIILDSVGGILPRAEAEKGAEGRVIGGQAKLMATFSRKVVPILYQKNVALIAINHAFTDLMTGKIMSSGGKKFAYHKSISIRLRQKTGVSIKQGERKVGKIVIGEVKKNKEAATEGLEVEGQLIFGTGFSAVADIVNIALDKNVITKEGKTFYFNGEKLAVGLNNVRKLLETDKDLAARIKSHLP